MHNFSSPGIPYAKAPVGKRRLAKPEKHGPFMNGGLNATGYGNVCAQMKGPEQIGSEDCLFLNIFTPGLISKKVRL